MLVPVLKPDPFRITVLETDWGIETVVELVWVQEPETGLGQVTEVIARGSRVEAVCALDGNPEGVGRMPTDTDPVKQLDIKIFRSPSNRASKNTRRLNLLRINIII